MSIMVYFKFVCVQCIVIICVLDVCGLVYDIIDLIEDDVVMQLVILLGYCQVLVVVVGDVYWVGFCFDMIGCLF